MGTTTATETMQALRIIKNFILEISNKAYEGLHGKQLAALLVIAEKDGITMKELRKEINQDQPQVSRVVAELSLRMVKDKADPSQKVCKGKGLIDVRQSIDNPHTQALYLNEKARR